MSDRSNAVHRHCCRSLLQKAGMVFLLGFVWLWCAECPADAVTISVSEFLLEGVPGERLNETFVVLNGDAVAVDISMAIVDWDRSFDGVTHFYSAGTLDRSCAAWMSISQHAATLPPGAETSVEFAVDVPEDLQGTRWAGLLITARAAGEDEEGVATQLVRQFLVRVFVTGPTTNPDGRVSKLQVHGIHPIGIDVAFSNTGDTLLADVSGIVTIHSQTGKLLLEIPVPSFDVLPGYDVKQRIYGDWDLPFPGLYLVRAVVDFRAEYLVAGEVVLHIEELALVPIGTSLNEPRDLDHDGLYEDIDGNGILDLSDVALLERFLPTSAVQDNSRAFDFNNDGEASSLDVASLQDIVLRALD